MDKEELLNVLNKYSLSLDSKDPIKTKYLQTLNVNLLREIYNSILQNHNLINVLDVKGVDISMTLTC